MLSGVWYGCSPCVSRVYSGVLYRCTQVWYRYTRVVQVHSGLWHQLSPWEPRVWSVEVP